MTLAKEPTWMLALRAAASKNSNVRSADEIEQEVQQKLARIWRSKEEADATTDPSLATIPRFFIPRKKPAVSIGSAPTAASLLRSLARDRLKNSMIEMVLDEYDLDQLWRLLKQHARNGAGCEGGEAVDVVGDERIDYDSFCQVAEAMRPQPSEAFFTASDFLKFSLDAHGRISIVAFYQWARRKNSLLRTRAEIGIYDGAGEGCVTESELARWLGDLIPTLPALSQLRSEFRSFYTVTAIRKLQFFLDPKRRGRIELGRMISSPVVHELLMLRRSDVSAEELRYNWFSLEYAENLYSDYLELDRDQNGMLSLSELAGYRGGGLTQRLVQRVFEECHSYPNKEGEQNEIDYKSYLDFVLATTYKGTPEALAYYFKLLDLRSVGRISAFEVRYFFSAVIDKFDQVGEEPHCSVEDVKDEIFDMVKPKDPLHITLKDLIDCKVGATVIGMLTDLYSFWQYDRREQLMGHEPDES